MSWNYRVVKSRVGYSLREVHYYASGRARAMSARPDAPVGETKKELVEVLERMLKDAKTRPEFVPPKRWTRGG